MEQEETVVATLPTVGEDKSLAEVEMGKEVSSVEEQASQIVISTQTDYESAAAFGKYIKQKAQQITDFFAPMKTAAHEAHKNICAREKEMLAPLIQAEKIVKDAMGGFIMEQERKRKEEEERIRRLAAEESDKKLREAMELEASGQTEAAEAALMEADIVDSASRNVVVEAQKIKADGASSSIDWEIVSVDDGKVPIDFSGVCIRPVDTKAILKLIRASKGKIKIPGITYKAVPKISLRK